MSVRVDHGVAEGTFSLDGEVFDVENNIWVVGDDDDCVVIDAPHDVGPILALVAGRRVLAVLCTHAHDDHVRVAPELGRAVSAPVLLHPADLPLIDVFGRGGALKSSWYGDCLPERDFPMLVDLYLQGRLPLDTFVSEEIGIGDVEAAFAKMHRGDVLRSVVIFPGASA